MALVVVFLALVLPVQPQSATAHPADRMKQHLLVGLAASEIRLSLVIGGGILANEAVLTGLDPDGDGIVTDAERATWIVTVLGDLRVTLDGTDLELDSTRAELDLPPLDDFHVGVSPLVLSLPIALSVATSEYARHLTIRNNYLLELTDHQLDVQPAAGSTLIDQSWPGRTVRISFTVDPAAATGVADRPDPVTAEAWGKGGVIARAKAILERPKSPAVIALLIGIFVVMGALHAIQPGHGKTLVAAYLVATKGTPRDALTLAGIVTFTHTVSVFLLGLATLAASRIFLPSRVVPVMGIVSGAIVAVMGLTMMHRALRRRRSEPSVDRAELSDPAGRSAFVGSSAPRASTSLRFAPHGPSLHDHEGLTEEEHVRLHLQEALAARRQGVDRRGLVTLGVAGGLAPCPDALAILLLAIGMNQAGFGMLAIVAFSAGLAGVLVAFGLVISLAGPAWSRARQSARLRDRRQMRLNAIFSRFVAVSPVVSAVVVLLLGLAMIWRASASV